MILAFLILDSENFPIFEFYNDKSIANDIIAAVEEKDLDTEEFTVGDLSFLTSYFSEKFRYCLVYRDQSMTVETKEYLPKIAYNVMKGDKMTLNQVLNAKSLQDLSYLK